MTIQVEFQVTIQVELLVTIQVEFPVTIQVEFQLYNQSDDAISIGLKVDSYVQLHICQLFTNRFLVHLNSTYEQNNILV